ncbi:hypothetical protein RB653_004487 [Dictyostelium firmibasis]|uniref:Major facilitator superfamily (MFS) profile domain-containing protein n=1 Tax=Dictyostelium firmibasis TaxID=79012 RepID=A0AAN7U9T4_9MYCE
MNKYHELSNSNSALIIENNSENNKHNSGTNSNSNNSNNIFSIDNELLYDDGRGEEDKNVDIKQKKAFKFKKLDNSYEDDEYDDGDLIFSNGGVSGDILKEGIKEPPKGIRGVIFYLCLSSYWLASSAAMGGLISLVWPSQIESIGGEENKAKYVGLLPILGAMTSIVAGPLSGFLSDHCTNRFGKRRIFIASGTVVAMISLFLTGTANNIYAFMLFLMGIQFGIMWGTSPFNGLMPDIVPKSKYGIASGYLAFSNAIGQLVGVVGTALLITYTKSFIVTYSFLVLLLGLLSLPTLIHIKEIPQSPNNVEKITWKRFIYSFYLPRSIYKDFYWVIITRFMQEMGIYSILPFFGYYLTDIIHVDQSSKELYTSAILSLIILTSIPSAIIGGPLSDKYGRKLLVYISCSIMTLITCGFIVLSFLPSLKLVLLFSGLFGVGYGCYQGVDYALALDVLPPENVAKDLSIWHQSLVVPQVIAPAISGLIINSFKSNIVLGYTIAFTIAVIWFLLSTIMIKPINLQRNQFIKLTTVDL